MAQFIVPNGVQVKLYWLNGGAQALNVVGATSVGVPVVNQAMADALDTSIKSAFTSTGLAGHMSDQVRLLRVGVRSVHSGNLPEFLGTTGEVIGTGTGDGIPRGVAAVVTLKTDRAGKSYRGRQYVGGFVESDNMTGNEMSDDAKADTEAFYAAIKTALTGNGLTMAVLSPALPERPNKQGDLLPPKPADARPVQAQVIRSKIWGSMRSRNDRT